MTRAPQWWDSLVRQLLSRETVIVLAVFAVIVATTLDTPGFVFSSDGWRELLISPAVLLLVAVGQAIVVITRNIDLSVGSIVGFSAYFAGRIMSDIPEIPIVLVVLLCVVVGAALGLVNAFLVAIVGLPALVITLGTLYAYRGILILWAGGTRIFPADLPPEFLALGTAQVLGIPLLTIAALVVLIAAGWYMKNTRGGRESYAIGSNPKAAELHGLKSRRRVLVALVTSGALSGLAGALYLARYATADSQAAKGWELQAVAAVVIGGVAIFGGSGRVWGAAFGAILLVTINRALPILGVPDLWQQATVGALILIAIVSDQLLHHHRLPRIARKVEPSG